MRLLSAEASVPLQNMRKGTVDQRDWTTIAATRGRINDAPLYIDDSPNMTLVEIRAKCRRLKQRVGLKRANMKYRSDISIFDGIDWWWGTSLLRAVRFLRSRHSKVLVLEWWTAATLHTVAMFKRGFSLASCPVAG